MDYDIRHNFPEVKAALLGSAKQARYAVARALAATALEIKAAELQEMQRVFKQPTRYTLNSLYVKTANKEDLTARVWFKQGSRPTHYLEPQVHGGPRPLKRFEEIMVNAGYMDRNERSVPGAGAVLDSFGNMSRGQIVQILSQLRAFNLAGSDANATNSKRSRKKRSVNAYFLSRGPRRPSVGGGAWKRGEKVQHLPRGVWVRRSFGPLGSSIRPVLIFVKSTSYQPRFKFFDIADDIVTRKLPQHFHRFMAEAWATAR